MVRLRLLLHQASTPAGLVLFTTGVLGSCPIQSSFARNAIPKSLPRTQLVLTRAFGGGSVGVQKVITVFGFMGGISIFMALAANALGLNTIYFFYAFLALCTWMFFGESNMGKHQVVGQSNLQEIHTLFTLCFLPVLYLFY